MSVASPIQSGGQLAFAIVNPSLTTNLLHITYTFLPQNKASQNLRSSIPSGQYISFMIAILSPTHPLYNTTIKGGSRGGGYNG